MTNNPFISIITASFNNESTIRNTIESIKNQTFTDIEHIIIDNCSTDKTLSIIKEYEGSYSLKWLSEPDKGIADALNKGLKQAKGKYILIIHADDELINPSILNEIYPDLKNQQYDIVNFAIIKDHPIKGKILILNKPLWQIHFKIPTLRHQGAFIHRRLHDKIGKYCTDYRIALDYDFFYRCVINKANIKIDTRPISIMGGVGIGSDKRSLPTRIEEDYRVQKNNEKNLFWKIFQFIFYIYKKHLRHIIRKSFENPNKYTST